MTTDGFSKRDTAKPPSKREVTQHERNIEAARIYYRNGEDLGAVRKALKLRNNQEALIRVNRGLAEIDLDAAEHIKGLRVMVDAIQSDLIVRLAKRAMGEDPDGGDLDLAAVDRLLKATEAHRRFHGLDKQVVQEVDVSLRVIDTALPVDLPDVIDGQFVEVKEIESGDSDDAV